MMKRILLGLVLVVALLAALATPASAKVKVREAAGTTTFTLTPQCEPGGPDPATACDLDLETGTLTIPLENPGTKTGSFKGTQHYSADFLLNVFTNTFTANGTVVFEGRVKGCGVGTVVFDSVGAGFLDENGVAVFVVNEQTILAEGTTLPIEGVLREPGALPTDPETGIGMGAYSGEYSCDHSGRQ